MGILVKRHVATLAFVPSNADLAVTWASGSVQEFKTRSGVTVQGKVTGMQPRASGERIAVGTIVKEVRDHVTDVSHAGRYFKVTLGMQGNRSDIVVSHERLPID